jgi:CBS-domain-containing membrane protein
LLDGSGGCATSFTIHCARRGHSEPLDACTKCRFGWSVPRDPARAGAAVECTAAARSAVDPRADVREAALRTHLHEVARRDVLCVREDASVETARALLLDHDLRALPVLDAEGRLVGIVTRSDLLRDAADGVSSPAPRALGPGFHVEEIACALVGEVMSPHAYALPEDAPLTYAVSLMAQFGLTEVPVVTGDGEVTGIVSSGDVMRWLATHLGYVLPP